MCRHRHVHCAAVACVLSDQLVNLALVSGGSADVVVWGVWADQAQAHSHTHTQTFFAHTHTVTPHSTKRARPPRARTGCGVGVRPATG